MNIYSKFGKENFHGKNPYPTRLLFVDEALYTWRFLEVHAASCFYTGRKDEAKASFQELMNLIQNSPQSFTAEDVSKIRSNSQFFS